jgi:hypothetical protein
LSWLDQNGAYIAANPILAREVLARQASAASTTSLKTGVTSGRFAPVRRRSVSWAWPR